MHESDNVKSNTQYNADSVPCKAASGLDLVAGNPFSGTELAGVGKVPNPIEDVSGAVIASGALTSGPVGLSLCFPPLCCSSLKYIV